MSVKDRLKFFIKSQKKTISAYEKELNVSNGYVNSISKGIGGEVLLSILEKSPNLNLNWLLAGEGEMLKKEEKKEVSVPATGQNTSILEQENAFLKRENELLQGQIKDKNKIITTLESNQKLLQEKLSAYEKSTHYATASQSITRPTL